MGAAYSVALIRSEGYDEHVIEDLRRLIAKRPFVPFTIHSVDGAAMRVPTVDHVYVPPPGNRVFVSFDDGSIDWIRPLMISRLTVEQETADA